MTHLALERKLKLTPKASRLDSQSRPAASASTWGKTTVNRQYSEDTSQQNLQLKPNLLLLSINTRPSCTVEIVSQASAAVVVDDDDGGGGCDYDGDEVKMKMTMMILQCISNSLWSY